MPKSKKLERQIEKKLDQLQKIVDEINEVQNINSDDSETWDVDTLYNLVEKLKEALKLLEDQADPKLRDEFGQPLIIAEGLCSLIDEYQEEEDEADDED